MYSNLKKEFSSNEKQYLGLGRRANQSEPLQVAQHMEGHLHTRKANADRLEGNF